MTVDQIRQKYYEQNGRNEEKIQLARNLLDVLDDKTIALKTGLDIEEVRKLRNNSNDNSKH